MVRGLRFLGEALGQGFGRSFWVFLGLAVVSGGACWAMLGWDAVLASFAEDLDMIAGILPRISAALLLAALVKLMIPRGLVARLVGQDSGVRGIAIATAAGALTPGGPTTSFPLVRALHDAGSATRPLIAYVTSWALLGLQRILVWEVPLMGLEFAAIRALASLPAPFIAAFLVRLVPLDPMPAPAGRAPE